MKVEVKVPAMGESISEAIVATIIKASGTTVNMDEEILELETDKVNQVLHAPQAGVLTLNTKTGDKVKIGQVLGFIDTELDQKEKSPKAVEPTPTKKAEDKSVQKNHASPTQQTPLESKTKEEPSSQARYGKEEFIQDLKQQEASKASSQPVSASSSSLQKTGQRETRKKMSNIRKVIATRMVEVKNVSAMLTTFNEVDMSQINSMREKYKDTFLQKYGVKLGFMSFFVKACVSALEQFPDINSYIDGDEIVHREYYDIGIAVGTDRGVIVPVIRNCEKLSYSEIESAIEQFAKKARDGSISVDDLQGGSFTITNGGIYGSMLSTPIINPGQSAILGLHKITKRPVVVDDEITIRPIMYLALSYDHRIVDGKEAVSFLVHIKNTLEYPGAALLGL